MKHILQSIAFICLFTFSFISCDKAKDTLSQPSPKFSSTVDYTGKTVTFKHLNPESGTEKRQWYFGDGKTEFSTGDSIMHTYDSAFAYVVTLRTVKNGTGVSGTADMIIKERLLKINTSFGEMIVFLYNETPFHRNNYLKLTSQQYLNGTTFHRLVNNFVIQGGDPNSKDLDSTNDGTGGPSYTIPAEIMPSLKHDFGAVGAARLGDAQNPSKASNGSQFYIVVNTSGTANLNNEYTVFGKTLKGTDVSLNIVKQPKNVAGRPYSNIPMTVTSLDLTRAEIIAQYGYRVTK
ncbi:MAG: peptidylprolyl isomerase [Bacteroidota bacterium]|nr:peptidylprolyl isomerase [Bacteroidota bacterium]